MSRGRSARAKGLKFEREVAQMLRPSFPGVRRQLEFQIQDAKGVDLQGCDPYKIQCKRLAKYVSVATIEEIQCDRAFGDVPVLVTAGDDQEPMAVLPLAEFIKLVSAGNVGAEMTACERCGDPTPGEKTFEWADAYYCQHCYNKMKTGR